MPQEVEAKPWSSQKLQSEIWIAMMKKVKMNGLVGPVRQFQKAMSQMPSNPGSIKSGSTSWCFFSTSSSNVMVDKVAGGGPFVGSHHSK